MRRYRGVFGTLCRVILAFAAADLKSSVTIMIFTQPDPVVNVCQYVHNCPVQSIARRRSQRVVATSMSPFPKTWLKAFELYGSKATESFRSRKHRVGTSLGKLAAIIIGGPLSIRHA